MNHLILVISYGLVVISINVNCNVNNEGLDITDSIISILDRGGSAVSYPDTLLLSSEPQAYDWFMTPGVLGCLQNEGYSFNEFAIADIEVQINIKSIQVDNIVEYSSEIADAIPVHTSKIRSYIVYSQPMIAKESSNVIVLISKIESRKTSAIYVCEYIYSRYGYEFDSCTCGINPY